LTQVSGTRIKGFTDTQKNKKIKKEEAGVAGMVRLSQNWELFLQFNQNVFLLVISSMSILTDLRLVGEKSFSNKFNLHFPNFESNFGQKSKKKCNRRTLRENRGTLRALGSIDQKLLFFFISVHCNF